MTSCTMRTYEQGCTKETQVLCSIMDNYQQNVKGELVGVTPAPSSGNKPSQRRILKRVPAPMVVQLTLMRRESDTEALEKPELEIEPPDRDKKARRTARTAGSSGKVSKHIIEKVKDDNEEMLKGVLTKIITERKRESVPRYLNIRRPHLNPRSTYLLNASASPRFEIKAKTCFGIRICTDAFSSNNYQYLLFDTCHSLPPTSPRLIVVFVLWIDGDLAMGAMGAMSAGQHYPVLSSFIKLFKK
ncbi:hypothetical protein BT96DRAFT_943276 [Gymnopus androsaceus JB14]|uniref:Uncharacterized protein n=1 Tax=Gymnopus androsaceus JB14 TaxID=1447944 RepID=A0A6A4H7S8_9AGAR|nr:hypothetical protein BT96DRAFT_943276 [Gymnopus androsaceus JB14]